MEATATTATAATTAGGLGKLWLVGGAIAVAVGAVAIGRGGDDDVRVEPVAAVERIAIEPTVERTSEVAPAPTPVAQPAGEPPIVAASEPTAEDDTRATPSRPTPRARTEPAAAAPKTSAEALLREAAAARRAGKRDAALALYQQIGRDFPSTREDRVARVAIGRIELDAGRPARALAAFEAYLRDHSTGNLAEEAWFGKAAALRALGRAADERRALQRFVDDFPQSVNLDKARARLTELGG